MGRFLLALTALLAVSATASAAPIPWLVGHWFVADHASALDSTPDYSAFVGADFGVIGILGLSKDPQLSVKCDRNGLNFAIAWPDYIGGALDTDPTNLTWKLDGGEVHHDVWKSGDRTLFMSGDAAMRAMKEWSPGHTLVVRVADQHGGQEATFQINGLDRVVARVSQIKCGSAAASGIPTQ